MLLVFLFELFVQNTPSERMNYAEFFQSPHFERVANFPFQAKIPYPPQHSSFLES